MFELLLVKIFVARLAGIASNILFCSILLRNSWFLLVIGSKELLSKQQPQSDCYG